MLTTRNSTELRGLTGGRQSRQGTVGLVTSDGGGGDGGGGGGGDGFGGGGDGGGNGGGVLYFLTRTGDRLCSPSVSPSMP